jgi:hypothetical protein
LCGVVMNEQPADDATGRPALVLAAIEARVVAVDADTGDAVRGPPPGACGCVCVCASAL